MVKPLILYLHGFTSGPQSRKVQTLTEHMRHRGIADRLLCPQLNASPARSIAQLEAQLQKVSPAASNQSGYATAQADDHRRVVNAHDTPITLIGSSLGGYYATWLAEKFALKAVLVNPAVVAAIELERYLGPQTWLYSGETFEFTRQHIAELSALEVPALTDPTRYWLLAETGDATLDYRQAVQRYAGARQTVLPGGDHSFTHWHDYLDAILDFAGFPA